MNSQIKHRISANYHVLLVIVPTLFSIIYIVQRQFDWGDDAGLYIMQAKCLVYGHPLQDLYESNRYLMQHSLSELGPYLYPMGTPILLSMVIRLFGVNFFAMKIMCAMFLVASIPIAYSIFQRYTRDRLASVFGLLLMYLNIYFLKEADSINSDLPFLFFSMLALHVMQSSMTITRGVATGLLVFACYITRDIGLFLLPAMFAKQLVDHLYGDKPFRFRTAILPYAVFAALFILQKTMIPNGQQNHYRMLFENFGPALFLKNVYYYKIQVGRFFISGDIPTILLLPILLLTVAGMFVHWKRSPHLIVYASLVMFILLLWPHYQGPRLMLPVIPFFILYTILGFQKIVGVIGLGSRVSHSMATLLLAFVTYLNVTLLYEYHERTSDRSLISSTNHAIEYIRSSVPDSVIVAFRDPRALTMHTGKKAIYTDLRHFDSSVASHLLIRDPNYSPGRYVKYRNIRLEGSYLLLEKK